MKRILSAVIAFWMALAACPACLWAATESTTFRVSVVIPERIELAAPSPLRAPEPSDLFLASESPFYAGPQTSTAGGHMDRCTVFRTIDGIPAQIFTLTVL